MNDNEFKEVKPSLIKRVYAKLKPAKISEKIGALMIATALVFSLSSCEIEGLPNNPPHSDNGGTNNNGGNNNNNQNNNNNENNNNQIDMSGYSKMLQNVLTNEYYDDLVYRTITNQEHNLLETGLFQPHPYTFLEKQGIDVEAIKNNQTEAYTMSYVLDEEPNNLYIYTRVLQNDSYYAIYLLKYELTDKEMDDYHLLHTGIGNTRYYIQSVFLNDEISKTKKVEIVGSSKMEKRAYEEMKKTAIKHEFVDADKCDVVFINPNAEEGTFNVKIIPNFYEDKFMAFESEIANIECLADPRFSGDVYTGPYSFGGSFLIASNEKENGTFYFPQDTYLNTSYCQDFENDHARK